MKWEERNDLKCNSGSITAAEGLLYLFTEDGKVGLVDADPKGFNLISSFEIPEKSTLALGRKTHKGAFIWAHPVIANGHLYLREQEYIFAYKIADK